MMFIATDRSQTEVPLIPGLGREGFPSFIQKDSLHLDKPQHQDQLGSIEMDGGLSKAAKVAHREHGSVLQELHTAEHPKSRQHWWATVPGLKALEASCPNRCQQSKGRTSRRKSHLGWGVW
uniref:Uncharacterized protein n=1 Tax=Molossus molossus TaxID=27622 RepID=A0A7J8E2Z0_MOLMO|nr:hypothetical protein HJG59_009050 [Molossus molossus]